MSWNHTDLMHYVFDSGAWERLSKNDLRVYLQLCKHYNIKDHISYPSINTLARETNLDRTTVIKSIKNLSNEVLVVIEKRRAREKGYISNAYQIPDYLLRDLENKKDPLVVKKLLGSIVSSKPSRNSGEIKHITHITNIYNSIIDSNKRTSYVSNEPSEPKDRWVNRGGDTDKIIADFLGKVRKQEVL